MANSSKAASGPRITSTLSRSISSCALVLVPAGLPPVSAEMKSTLRPAILLSCCFSQVSTPCSIWMPPCASGPVLTVSRPSLKGAACAMAGVGNLKVASAAPAAVAAINLRRVTLRDIVSSLCRPWAGLYVLSGDVRASLNSPHSRIQLEYQKPSFRAVVASATYRSKPIIGQCIPVCKARLRRCAAAYSIASIAVVGMARPAVLDLRSARTVLAIIGGERPRWP